MFRRKLLSLEHPCADNFDINNVKAMRSLVLWTEDQKIRHYKIEDREALRQLDSVEWPNAFSSYLKDLACPIKSDKVAEQLEWLLGYAVRLAYTDDLEKYKAVSTGTAKQEKTHAPQVITENPLDNLDFNSQEFKDGVNSLASLLKVTQHPDHRVTLSAISKIVSQRLTQDALANPNKIIVKGTPFPFQEADLGFDTGDYVLNQAAKILRLLYIQDMRDLQTRINECIVAVQNVTANPKTDTKLGKVGY